jgi:hypothetical protein
MSKLRAVHLGVWFLAGTETVVFSRISALIQLVPQHLLPQVKGQGLKLTTHLHVGPWVRTHELYPDSLTYVSGVLLNDFICSYDILQAFGAWCFKSRVTWSFTYVLQFIYWTFDGAQIILTGVFCDLSHSILKGIRVVVSVMVCLFVSLCVMVLHIRSQMTSWDSIFKQCMNQSWK